jgi:hypothetical protein
MPTIIPHTSVLPESSSTNPSSVPRHTSSTFPLVLYQALKSTAVTHSAYIPGFLSDGGDALVVAKGNVGLTEAMYNMTTTPGDTASSQFDLADHLDRAVLFSPDLTPSIPQGGGRGCAPGGKTLRGMHDPLESVSAYSNACSPLLLNLSDFYYGAGLTKMTNRVREIQNKDEEKTPGNI